MEEVYNKKSIMLEYSSIGLYLFSLPFYKYKHIFR